MKILMIEDDNNIINAVTFAFKLGWPNVTLLPTGQGQKGIDLVESENPDIVLLDLGLPDINGLEVIKQIRLFSEVPILILTVNVDEATVVQALELGANDYVFKPFRQMELLARVKRLIKASHDTGNNKSLVYGPFIFNYTRRELIYNERKIDLQTIENEIIYQLLKNAPNIVEYSALARTVWGSDEVDVSDCLRVHIHKLRNKISKAIPSEQIIRTKTGVGYYIPL